MRWKLLCTADLHLGLTFSSYDAGPEFRKKLAEARWSALGRIVETAEREDCRLLIVAGDLFDRARVSAADLDRAAETLLSFHGGAVALLPGNHDYYDPEKPLWRELERRGDGRFVTLLEGKPRNLEELDVPAVLYPGPCGSIHSPSHVLDWIKRESLPADGRLALIGVAHGSLAGISPDMDGKYYPMDPDFLERLGLGLWIVGHTHSSRIVKKARSTLVVPGTPEPDGFDHDGEGVGVLVGMEDGAVADTRFVPVSSFRFAREELVVRGSGDFAGWKPAKADAASSTALLRLHVRGRLAPELFAEYREWKKKETARWLYAEFREEGLEEAVTRETVEREFAPGSFPHELLVDLLDDAEALQAAWELAKPGAAS